MFRFTLWLLGVLMIVSAFLSLALIGALSVTASFFIGWVVCGIYSVVMFCGIGGEPENVGGTSIIMIIGGALTLMFVLCMTAVFEISFRPKHKLVYNTELGYPYYVPKEE